MESTPLPKKFSNQLQSWVKKKNEIIIENQKKLLKENNLFNNNENNLFQLKISNQLYSQNSHSGNYISGLLCGFYFVMGSMGICEFCLPEDSLGDSEEMTGLGRFIFFTNCFVCSPIWFPIALGTECYRQSRLCCDRCKDCCNES